MKQMVWGGFWTGLRDFKHLYSDWSYIQHLISVCMFCLQICLEIMKVGHSVCYMGCSCYRDKYKVSRTLFSLSMYIMLWLV